MSDDSRTDFFSSGTGDDSPTVPATDSDPRTSFFQTGEIPARQNSEPSSEPVYDAAEFKRRVGRNPTVPELANFKQFKGEGFASGNGGGSLAGMGEAALATGASALKGVSHAANDILPDWGGSKASVENELNTDPILNYRGGPEAEPYLQGIKTLMTPVTWAANKIHQGISDVASPRTADVVGDIATLLPAARGMVDVKGIGRKVVQSMDDPESASAKNSALDSPQSLSAAASPVDLTGVSPQLRDVIQRSANPHPEALQRHIDADTLPMPEGMSPLQLRKGQAMFHGQQISDEKNLRADPDTQDILANSITDQNDKLGASMGEIRRRATPDIVQRSNLEHGQTGIDAIKTEDNAAILDTRAKYKALADANGGALPLDTSQALAGIRSGLNEGFLNKTARDDPVVSEVLEQLESGRPMTFEQFENARTNLADVQRRGGSEAKAAAIVRGQLEHMPLSTEAANLKGLADTARAAAKSRFDRIKENPAYEAVVNDNVPKTPKGLHIIGTASPLADTFMDRYFLGNGPNASRAYIERLQGIMQNNSDFAPAVEGASLNKLRDAAGLDIYNNGNFRNASYRNARDAMDKKADVLMSPESAANTEQLKRVSGYVHDEPKDASVNRSNTALTLQRFGALYPETPGIAGTLADYGADIAAAHVGPVGYAAKKIGSAILKSARDRKAIEATRAAKLNFARDATAPGAGIEMPNTSPIARASGGKVDQNNNSSSIRGRNFSTIGQIRDAIKNNNNMLYVRWSRNVKHDLKKGARSRDYITGETHAGLSARDITSDMPDHKLASALSEYGSPGLVPHIYSGTKVGTDSDGYPSISNLNHIGSLSPELVNQLRTGLPRWLKLRHEIQDGQNRLQTITDPFAKKLVQNSVENNKNELAEMPNFGNEIPQVPSLSQSSDPLSRAAGGKVDHEALVNRLIQRWKSAKKATDKTTEPLLRQPDAAIVRALEISQEHI